MLTTLTLAYLLKALFLFRSLLSLWSKEPMTEYFHLVAKASSFSISLDISSAGMYGRAEA